MKCYDKTMRKFIDRYDNYTIFHKFSTEDNSGGDIEDKGKGYRLQDAIAKTPKNKFRFRTGDIVLIRRGGNIRSKLVTIYTGTFSHVGMIYMDGRVPKIFEASPSKGEVVLSDIDILNGCYVVVLRSRLGIKDISNMKKKMESYIGVKYETTMWEFIKFILPLKGIWWNLSPSKSQFCSELIINIINESLGYDIPKVNWWHPGSFTTNNYLSIKMTSRGNY